MCDVLEEKGFTHRRRTHPAHWAYLGLILAVHSQCAPMHLTPRAIRLLIIGQLLIDLMFIVYAWENAMWRSKVTDVLVDMMMQSL